MSDLDASVSWTLERMGRWGRRVTTEACRDVAPGSALDVPPLIDPSHTTGRLAWRALGTAGEHAGLAFYLTYGSGAVPTKPFLSLARTALLGAARALYVLVPDEEHEREIRTLQLLRSEANDVLNVVKDGERSTGQPDTSGARKEAEQFKADCEAALQARGHKPGSVIKETDLLTEVAPLMPPDSGSRDPLLLVMALWRMGSGTAHARTWAWDMDLEDQPAELRLAVMWSTPMALMDSAWTLWCKRRGNATDID